MAKNHFVIFPTVLLIVWLIIVLLGLGWPWRGWELCRPPWSKTVSRGWPGLAPDSYRLASGRSAAASCTRHPATPVSISSCHLHHSRPDCYDKYPPPPPYKKIIPPPPSHFSPIHVYSSVFLCTIFLYFCAFCFKFTPLTSSFYLPSLFPFLWHFLRFPPCSHFLLPIFHTPPPPPEVGIISA